MKIHDSLSGALLLVLAGILYWHTRGFPEIPGDPVGPALFPRIIAAGMALCGIALVVTGLVREKGVAWVEVPGWVRAPRQLAGFAVVVLGLLAFYFFLDRIGFLVGAALLFAALLFTLRVRAWAIPVVAIGVTLLIHTIFYKGLGVPLPWGVLAPWAW
jgi:putative tricarboxylic transport membrane protein